MLSRWMMGKKKIEEGRSIYRQKTRLRKQKVCAKREELVNALNKQKRMEYERRGESDGGVPGVRGGGEGQRRERT